MFKAAPISINSTSQNLILQYTHKPIKVSTLENITFVGEVFSYMYMFGFYFTLISPRLGQC